MAELTPTRKRVAILIVVLGSALIGERVMTLMGDDTDGVEPSSKPTARARSAVRRESGEPEPSASRVRLDRLDARRQMLADGDALHSGSSEAALFGPVSWQPPVAKAAAAPAPATAPKPQAPPFPYVYAGGLSEDGVRTAFFTQGNRVIPVKAGDTVDAVYRVDQMTEKQMKLTYLPLNESLVLAFGATP